jgi:chromosome segregation ATPase
MNQRAQLRSVEECMKNLHALNASKGAEIENLHKEIKNLNDQIGTITAEKEQLSVKIEEHDLLLKGV